MQFKVQRVQWTAGWGKVENDFAKQCNPCKALFLAGTVAALRQVMRRFHRLRVGYAMPRYAKTQHSWPGTGLVTRMGRFQASQRPP